MKKILHKQEELFEKRVFFLVVTHDFFLGHFELLVGELEHDFHLYLEGSQGVEHNHTQLLGLMHSDVLHSLLRLNPIFEISYFLLDF